MTIEQYLQKVSRFRDDQYGSMIRNHFKDHLGSSELGMLHCPTKSEVEQIKIAVAIMTDCEKNNAATLTNEQIGKISEDAQVDPGIFAIFINGYAIMLKNCNAE